MTIRHYESKDKINVRQVCIATSTGFNAPEKEQRFITKLYCDYYIEQEPQNCFVIADDDDNAVGYILCSENMKRYARAMAPYRASIQKMGFVKYIYAWGEYLAHVPASKKCNAHLHIDILPEYQHKGLGTRLINTLTDSLSAKGINSVMLVVNTSNKNAVSFYKKNGFKEFLNFGQGILMTKTF